MYNGRMWLVVKPTVGVPLFFGGVALASLAVHTAVLTNTTWFPAFLNGKTRAAVAAAAPAPAAATASDVSSAAAIASAQAALVSAQAGLAALQTTMAAPK